MFSFSIRASLLLSLLFSGWGCVREVPTLIVPPTPIGDGGRLIRDLYRASWVPPGTDSELIQVGLVPSSTEVRFRALAPLRIRAYSESDSWEVASPDGVIWKVAAGPIVRPPIVAHFASVKQTLLRPDQHPPAKDLALWAERGYASVRWVGPVSPENRRHREPLERWVLALTPPTGRASANLICSEARQRFKTSCQVVARVELPPIGQGVLTAENSTFAKSFQGFLEILSPQAPVEVLDLPSETGTGETTRERYGPRLFVVPNVSSELSLIQSNRFATYLEGVVASEIFPEAPPAALQAQAVVARTYALRFFRGEESQKPYLICATTSCQVYRGTTQRRDGPSAAVRSTENMVLRESAGGFAETFYHSICGGHTEPREEIWGGSNRGYLSGVSDELPNRAFTPLQSDNDVRVYLDAPPTSFCGTSSFTKHSRWRWDSDLSGKALDAVATNLGLASPLRDVTVRKRGISGRALRVEFQNLTASKTVEGELQIRQLLGNLPSSLFVLDLKKNGGAVQSLHIRGAGFGHGVGLCQVGAIGRAEHGQTFEEILNAYYPGTRLAPAEKGVIP